MLAAIDFNEKALMDQLTNLEPSWKSSLALEFKQEYFKRLCNFLKSELDSRKAIYPPLDKIHNWSFLCPLSKVKVVILGQDPYHGVGQAMGLCFSVPPKISVPPSLVNIYKELKSNIDGFEIPQHGCLEGWAKQGVLLLNTSLTVRAHEAASHANRGWEQFTDSVIRVVNKRKEPVVFMLWGNHALKKCRGIDRKKHLVLEAVHPSPLSAHKGFFGCQHFIKANQFLIKNNLEPIDWSNLTFSSKSN